MIAIHLREHVRTITVGPLPLSEKYQQLNSLETAAHWLEKAGAITPAEKADILHRVNQLRGVLQRINNNVPMSD